MMSDACNVDIVSQARLQYVLDPNFAKSLGTVNHYVVHNISNSIVSYNTKWTCNIRSLYKIFLWVKMMFIFYLRGSPFTVGF